MLTNKQANKKMYLNILWNIITMLKKIICEYI